MDITFTLDEVKKKKGFCISHLNIRSMVPKMDELKCHFLDGQIEIVGISETWLHSKIESALIQVDEYHIIRQDRCQTLKKRGGGLCLYVADYLLVEKCDKDVNNNNLELLSIRISQQNWKGLSVILVYRPPNGDIDYFFEKMREVVQSLPDKDEVIIMGDINIDYLGKKNLATSKLYKWEKELLLDQIIRECTRVCETSQTCIDLIFTNINFISDAGVIDLHLSDHKPVFLIKKKPRNESNPKKLITRGSRFDYDRLKSEFNTIDWGYVALEQNP